jgi:hypothetical protein
LEKLVLGNNKGTENIIPTLKPKVAEYHTNLRQSAIRLRNPDENKTSLDLNDNITSVPDTPRECINILILDNTVNEKLTQFVYITLIVFAMIIFCFATIKITIDCVNISTLN